MYRFNAMMRRWHMAIGRTAPQVTNVQILRERLEQSPLFKRLVRIWQ